MEEECQLLRNSIPTNSHLHADDEELRGAYERHDHQQDDRGREDARIDCVGLFHGGLLLFVEGIIHFGVQMTQTLLLGVGPMAEQKARSDVEQLGDDIDDDEEGQAEGGVARREVLEVDGEAHGAVVLHVLVGRVPVELLCYRWPFVIFIAQEADTLLKIYNMS